MLYFFQASHSASRVRTVLALTTLVPLAIVLWSPIVGSISATAKTPGKRYCFHGYCHRVLTLNETRAQIGQRKTVTASFYSHCKQDRYNPCGLTSSGAVFRPSRDDNGASPIYPNGTKLLVWNPTNRRAAIIRIDNAGPYWGNRTLDLSRAAARKLGFEHRGVARLSVQVLSAPTRREATYRRHRVYPAVPGYIGQYATLASAELATATPAAALNRLATNMILPVRRPPALVALALAPVPAKRPFAMPPAVIAQSAPLQQSYQTAMVELPTSNAAPEIKSPENVPPDSITLPVALLRSPSQATVRKMPKRRQRLSALATTKPKPTLQAQPPQSQALTKRTKRVVSRVNEAQSSQNLRRTSASKTAPAAPSRISKPNSKASPTKLNLIAQKKTPPKTRPTKSPVAAPNAQPTSGANQLRTAQPSALPAPASLAKSQTPPLTQPTRLAWRQKYFSMNAGGS